MEASLANVWLVIIAFFLLYYGVTDGFDLGVGILCLLTRDNRTRLVMMESIGSIWHTNQTWLVVLGGMLFGAFPLFYALVLSSLYIPILIMLFGFVFRGVAFEFREHSRQKRVWCLSFGLGSLIATLAQGFALGGLVGGLPVESGRFVGSLWGWLNPFSALVAAGVLSGYTMLGTNYLILKADGQLQKRSFRQSLIASCFTLLISIGVHLWVTARYAHVAQKWGTLPDLYYVAVFPLLALLSFVLLLHSLWKRCEISPLLWNIALILFSFIGLSVGLYPDMIPNVISQPVTVRAAAASPKTLTFMLGVMAVLIPVILVYTAYTYRVFRGKIAGEDYGDSDSRPGV